MNKTASIIIAITLVIGIGIMVLDQSRSSSDLDSTQQTQNIEVRDGVQYITINARGGYSPRVSTAQSNMPTKLIVKTNGTYDCSASLVIRSIGYQKVLNQTGEEVIDLGTPQSNTTVQGTCSMGMYSFKLIFI